MDARRLTDVEPTINEATDDEATEVEEVPAPGSVVPRRARLVIGETYIELPPDATEEERESAIERAALFGYRPIGNDAEADEEISPDGGRRIYLEPITAVLDETPDTAFRIAADQLDRLEEMARALVAAARGLN